MPINLLLTFKYYIIVLVAGANLVLLPASRVLGQPVALAKPLEQGHSHNDYWRDKPLYDALQRGFKSVEADIFLSNGQLLVGHSTKELEPTKTLESLYLQPLRSLVRQHKGLYHPAGVLLLYIDIKTEGKATYEQLVPELKKYQSLLVKPGRQQQKGYIKVILTGNYPQELVLRDKQRLVYLDGKVEALPQGLDAAVYPVTNGNWANLFTWRGAGPMPPAEVQLLEKWQAAARQNGQQVRFWGISEHNQTQLKAIWQQLLSYPNILIGTDHLDWLTEMLAEQRKK